MLIKLFSLVEPIILLFLQSINYLCILYIMIKKQELVFQSSDFIVIYIVLFCTYIERQIKIIFDNIMYITILILTNNTNPHPMRFDFLTHYNLQY